ncbi:MAG TPA: ParB/RepB/Spo0J family partition protein [Anaerolineales bacterium]|nr:ParB/RepB/Spo0J family partition protein [Anaerolineales bacterium]
MTQTTQPTLAIEIDITHIERNPKQPRQSFNNDDLNHLAASIREHGVIQPLIVTPGNANGIHTLIAGERRLIAAGRAQRQTVPAIIREVACEQDYLILALVENVDRSEMTPVEEGDGYLALRAQGMSNAEIARKVGVTDARVGNCINCASLPEKTRALINKGQLFISNRFISRLRDIAEISPKACDELTQQIAETQPALKAANKTATTVLNQLSAIKKEKPTKKKKNIFDAASNLADLDIDESQPPSHNKWDVLKEAGYLPPWSMVVETALAICAGCDLYGFASHPICSACTAARMLAQLAKKAEEQEA